MKAKQKFLIDSLDNSYFTVFIKSKSTLSTTKNHISVYHHLEILLFTFPLLILLKNRFTSVLNGLNFQEIYALLKYLDKIWGVSFSHLQNLGNQIDNFFIKGCEMVFLLAGMPPSYFYSQTYLFVNLGLAGKDSLGTLNTLFHVFSDFMKRLSQRLTILTNDRQDILDVHFPQKLLLKSFYIFRKHIPSEGLELT